MRIRRACFWTIFAVIFLLSVNYALAEQKEIRLLYMNDFHGFAEAHSTLGTDEPAGGISFLAARVNTLRKEKPSLLLAAGDMIQGNIWTNLFEGRSVIEVMNAMGFDAMTVGNHEFDFGQAVLKQRISEASFPVLGANIDGLDGLRPYVIKEVSGIRVGIIGIVTEDVSVSTHPRNVAGLRFGKAADSVSKYLDVVRHNADIVVVLSHTGYENDRALAEEIPVIDVIVGGHSHTRVATPQVVGKTIIVQAWEHAKALGVLDLILEDGKISRFSGRLEDISPLSGGEDARIAAIVEKYRRNVDSVLNEVIGKTDVDLDGENVRLRETNLGDLLADIMKKAAASDLAIINAGTIRTSIKKGEIRVKDVYSVLPFDNYVVAIRLTGSQILEALEHGVSAIEKGEGRFPQVSGLAFRYRSSSPPGKRVSEVMVGDEELDPEKEYSVATNDFLAAGGDGYHVFGDVLKSSADSVGKGGVIRGLVFNDAGRCLRDVFIAYVKEKKDIFPHSDRRIVRID